MYECIAFGLVERKMTAEQRTSKETIARTVLANNMKRLVRLCQRATIGDFQLPENDTNSAENDSNDEDKTTDCSIFDLIEGHEVNVGTSPSTNEMGQKTSALWQKPNLSLTWALKNDITLIPNNSSAFLRNSQLVPMRKQNNLTKDPSRHCVSARSVSPSSTVSTARPGRRRRVRRPRPRPQQTNPNTKFGYQIQDVDEFLAKASLDSPGNIPMVLSTPCVLYQTQLGAPQKEVSLPLGMVVNGVLKNQAWLYAQTPHGEEGYVPYACCLPLGILPPPSRPQPCWDTQTDIFPRPCGNRTDTEKIKEGTRSESGIRSKRIGRESLGGERNVDGLYLQASRKAPTRHTLLVIGSDYKSPGRSALSVTKGDVVTLVSSHMRDWFWVRDRDGHEGFIPAVVAGHGFL